MTAAHTAAGFVASEPCRFCGRDAPGPVFPARWFCDRCQKWQNDAGPSVADLQAILAPLLDDPLRLTDYDREYAEQAYECSFCAADSGTIRVGAEIVVPHKPDCPVLRKDEFLGRTPPPA